MDTPKLTEKARWVRRQVLESVARSGKGHIGGTYSATDLFVAFYYGGILRFDPSNPRSPDRDRLLVGKGHACLALYAIFMDLGMITPKLFAEYGVDGGALGGQLDTSLPGVEYNTGSLGHALGVGAGMALAAKMSSKDYRVFTLLGDAECYEGSIWEGLIFAGQHKLNNLVAIIDRNRLSVTDTLGDDSFYQDFMQKLSAFGWEGRELNGHSMEELLAGFSSIRSSSKPVLVLANTIKGKGISFMENGIKWHHGVPNAEELAKARTELAID